MTASFAAMGAFGIVLLCSWAGWGVAIHRFALRGVVADRALQAGWGLSLTLLVGGLLNVTRQISPRSIVLLLSAGVALLLWDAYRHRLRLRTKLRLSMRRVRRERLLALALTALFGSLAAVYAASICSTHFNDHDDLQAYFVFPAKMIQTGALGPDPFSERRVLSLGSMSFLHAIILAVADSKYLRIVDPGVSLLLSAALLTGIARVARTDKWACVVVLLLFLVIPPPADNTTSCFTGLCLFLTLFLTLYRICFGAQYRDRVAYLGSIPVALTASALCSLKTTHVPATVLLALAAYSIRTWTSRRRSPVIKEAVLAGALTILFLAPWMASLYRSNGTLLFPLLGRGFHGSAYGTYWGLGTELTLGRAIDLMTSTLVDANVAPLIILGAGALLRSNLGERRLLLVGWALGATLSALSVTIAAGGADARYRYSYAFLIAAICTLALFSLPRGSSASPQGGSGEGRLWQLRGSWPVGVLALSIVAAGHSATVLRYASSQVAAVKHGLEASENPNFMLHYVRRYAKMQGAIPVGATALTRLQYPFLLDFRRNQIFIADYPGGSSPPPGIPFFKGADRLADYLCRRPIRYVAYSYRHEAGFYDDLFKQRLSPRTDPWSRLQALHTQDFQRSLAELGRTRKSLYDDGDVFVLDLATSSSGQPLSCTPS